MRQSLFLILACLLLSGCYTLSGGGEAQREVSEAPAASESNAEAPRYARAEEGDLAVFQRPSTSSPIVVRLAEGEEIIVHGQRGGFYAVADAEGEPLGYALRRSIEVEEGRRAPDVAASSVNRDSPPTSNVGYKDPGTAQLIGLLITGGGQFYVGKTRKGATLLTLGIMAPVAGWYAATANCQSGDCSGAGSVFPLYIGAGVGIGAWIYGIGTAGNDAREVNRQRGINLSVEPAAIPDGKSVRPGLALSLEW